MIVVSLTACTTSLRGDLTKWLIEVSPGVFVGKVTARVRDRLWERIEEFARDGHAVMVYSARNEQGFQVRVHQPSWEPIDLDGLTLVRRAHSLQPGSEKRTGWSQAALSRRSRYPSWRNRQSE